MLLETLLPLGKVDPGLRAPEVPLDLGSIGRDARPRAGHEGADLVAHRFSFSSPPLGGEDG